MSEVAIPQPTADSIKLIKILDGLNRDRKRIADYLGVHERTLYRWISGDSPKIPAMAFRALELLAQRP